jgi:hypothetical protein
MLTRLALAAVVLFHAFLASAEVPMCGTSAELEQRLLAHRERLRQTGIALNAAPATVKLRDGAFYLEADAKIASGGSPFDLAGKSLVFEPRGPAAFAVRRVSSQFAAPGELLHDFGPKSGTPWHYVTWDLQSFAFPIFGRSITRLYLTAFNEIELDVPAEEGALTFDELEAAVHRNPVLSPLMITGRKPRQLAYPQLFVRETSSSLFVTWRSTAGETFGYDVQAELRRDGTVVYSYNSPRNMQWGTPIVSPGFDPNGATTRRTLYQASMPAGVSSTFGSLGPMLDIRGVEVSRMGESDVLAVRVRLAGPIDLSKLGEDVTLRYQLTVSNQPTYVDVTRSGWKVLPLGAGATVPNGSAANISGDTIEFYLLQSPATVTTPQMRVTTQLRPSRTADGAVWTPTLDVAPRSTGNDLSAETAGRELQTPIAEPFVLPVFDPAEAWSRIRPAFAISDYDVDAVAIYQTFFTDMIFYAGAYSISGNAGVSGLGLSTTQFGPGIPRRPNVLHMNQLTYNYNAATETASQVILHEFGHRWLYFFRILEGNAITSSLNPVSAHPAAYVNTPAAFPVFREGEASVMGGAVFTAEGASTYRAHASNRGFSWVDLYLMGMASPSEVAPWFYLAGTGLRPEYWPDDGVVVSGEKRDVGIDQVLAVQGLRDPAAGMSQKKFRVLFVLVTEPGREASVAEVAKINEWRGVLERTFSLATGGRGRVETTFVQPPKKRATR